MIGGDRGPKNKKQRSYNSTYSTAPTPTREGFPQPALGKGRAWAEIARQVGRLKAASKTRAI